MLGERGKVSDARLSHSSPPAPGSERVLRTSWSTRSVLIGRVAHLSQDVPAQVVRTRQAGERG